MSEITFTSGTGQRWDVDSMRLYSDTTPMIKLDAFAEICERADTMILRPKSLTSFVNAMFLIDAIDEQGGEAGINNLVLPYIPGARQDRSNPTGDVLFTLKSVANMINERLFSDVLVLDPHSPVALDLINEVVEYPLDRVAAKLWQGYTGIIAADKGGVARAQAFAKAMNKPIFYGSKERDVATGKLRGFWIEKLPEGGHFLVVDDICDGGGTFLGLGEEIKKQGAHIDLFVTHGIFSHGSAELRKVYKNVYTTDSRDIHDHHVMQIPIMEDLENYL